MFKTIAPVKSLGLRTSEFIVNVSKFGIYPSFKPLPIVFLLGISLSLSGCDRFFRPLDPTPTPTPQSEALIFNDITLEQVDPEGKKVWELEAETVTYAPETQLALVDKPTGLLFEEGKPTYRVSATSGEVDESTPTIILRGTVVLEALIDQGVLKGDQLTWKPEEEIFILEGNLTGTYEDIKFTGQRGELQNQIKTLTVTGKVVADLQDSDARLKTEALTWDMNQERVQGILPVVLEHYEADKPDQVIDRATGDGITALIPQQRFTLSPNAIVTLGESQLAIRSQSLTWDAIEERVESPGSVTVVRSTDGLEVKGNSGNFELKTQIATLVGAIEAWNPKQAARLWGDRLVWELKNDRVEATGVVRYEQGNPILKIEGDRAVGLLNSEELTVTSSQRSVKTVYVLP